MEGGGANNLERDQNGADYIKNRFYARVFEGEANSAKTGLIEED